MASLIRVNFIVVLTGLCILSLAQTDKLTIPIGKCPTFSRLCCQVFCIRYNMHDLHQSVHLHSLTRPRGYMYIFFHAQLNWARNYNCS